MTQPSLPSLLSRRVVRQMDHFILATAADPSATEPTALLSLYWFTYAAEGDPGHIAYLSIAASPGRPSLEVVLTDNPALEAAIGPGIRPGQFRMSEPAGPVLRATFTRSNLRPFGFAYSLESGNGLRIDAAWEDLSEPVFATGTARSGNTIATILVEARLPRLIVGGNAVPGVPFRNAIWEPWVGRQGTGSCFIGLGEVIYEPATDA